MDALDRIESTPGVLGGKPRIRGTRIPVELIASMLSNGYETGEILEQFPELTREDIAQSEQFTSRLES